LVRLRLRKCSWFGACSHEKPGETVIPSTPRPVAVSKKRAAPSDVALSKRVELMFTRKPFALAEAIAATAFSYTPS
jgi:hypothetical protein